MQRIVVIGGGIAGLMAAAHLAEAGLQPVLLEADPEWVGGRLKGGSAMTFEHAGKRWDFPGEHGVHGIWLNYRNFRAVLTRYGMRPDFVPAREETWIFGQKKQVRRAPIGSAIRGSLLPAPFHYLYCFLRPSFLNMLTLYDVVTLPRVLMSLFAAMAIDPLAERKSLQRASLADFTRHWSPRLRSLFAGLARSGLSAHPDEVPASGWIAFLRFYTLLRRDSWEFAYLPGTGGTCVAEPLAAHIRRLGGEIRLGCRVENLERQADQWQITLQQHPTDASSSPIEADQVILAVDAPAAEHLLRESPATAEVAAGLRFPAAAPTAIIRLWFALQPRPIAEAGIYTGDFAMDNFFWLHRLQPDYTIWSKETGGSAIEMHVYSSPELLALSDTDLLARVVADTYRAFPELSGHLLHKVLLRNEPTHTIFGVGNPDEHLGITTPWPNLFACGDWVYHPSPALFLERATVTGIAAANAVLAQYGLDAWGMRETPRPEMLAGKIAAMLWHSRQWVLKRRQAQTDH